MMKSAPFARVVAVIGGMGAAAALATSSASAADLGGYRSLKDPEVIIGPSDWSWRGFYTGINLGYGFGGDDRVQTSGTDFASSLALAANARPGRVGLDTDGVIGGVGLGYNIQRDNLVFGFETDIDAADIGDTKRVGTVALDGINTQTSRFSKRLDYLGTVRGRLGIAYDHTLFFATAGFAYGGVSDSAKFYGTAGDLQYAGRTSDTQTGYVVGGGIEHAFSPNWSLKGEYLYYDIGSQTVAVNAVPGSAATSAGYATKFENDGHILRMGLNYKF